MTKKELAMRYIKRILCFMAGHRFIPDVIGCYFLEEKNHICVYCGKKDEPIESAKLKKKGA